MQDLYFQETVGVEDLEKALPTSRFDRYFGDSDFVLERQDYFNNLRKPSKETLIDNYKGTVYACANINAGTVAAFEPKLFVKTEPGQKNTVQRTRKIDQNKDRQLRQQFKIREDVLIEEIVEHPALKLLQRVDASEPLINQFLLWEMTQLYQEVCGEAYWWVRDNNIFGIPQSIMLLPSQFVHPEQDEGSKKWLDRYVYKYKDFEKKFQPGEVIQFLSPGLKHPYLKGLSPEEASYEASTLINKLKSMMTGVLSREARPDIVLSPKETLGSDEAKSYERRLNIKFSQGKSGGIKVIEEPMDLHILNFPPKDYANQDIQRLAKNDVCNACGVPVPLLEAEGMNRETLEAALAQHAVLAIKPRLMRNAGVLNKQLLSRYDDSGRLFFAFDDPVPENREIKLQENVQLKMNGCKTGNEVRSEYNLPPLPDGDTLDQINLPGSGSEERDNSRVDGTSEK